MAKKKVERIGDDLIARFTENVCRAVREHLEAGLEELVPSRRDTTRPSREPKLPQVVFEVPAPVALVRAGDHVERLIEIVRQLPWPAQSHELQRLLGVKKDPFLRIAKLALATGRIRRRGQKAGVRYFPA